MSAASSSSSSSSSPSSQPSGSSSPASSSSSAMSSPSQSTKDFLEAVGVSGSEAYSRVKDMTSLKVDNVVLEHLISRVSAVTQFGLARSRNPSSRSAGSTSSSQSPSQRGRTSTTSSASTAKHDFAAFAEKVLRRAEVSMPVVLGVLVYIDRAKPHLRISLEEWAHHRVLLGALIAASKYLNDSSLKNADWALCTSLFGRRDVLRIESEFLAVLNFELALREEHLLPMYDEIAALRREQDKERGVKRRHRAVTERMAEEKKAAFNPPQQQPQHVSMPVPTIPVYGPIPVPASAAGSHSRNSSMSLSPSSASSSSSSSASSSPLPHTPGSAAFPIDVDAAHIAHPDAHHHREPHSSHARNLSIINTFPPVPTATKQPPAPQPTQPAPVYNTSYKPYQRRGAPVSAAVANAVLRPTSSANTRRPRTTIPSRRYASASSYESASPSSPEDAMDVDLPHPYARAQPPHHYQAQRPTALRPAHLRAYASSRSLTSNSSGSSNNASPVGDYEFDFSYTPPSAKDLPSSTASNASSAEPSPIYLQHPTRGMRVGEGRQLPLPLQLQQLHAHHAQVFFPPQGGAGSFASPTVPVGVAAS